MIHIKDKLNKTATLKKLKKDAEKRYKNSYEPYLQVAAFMKGVETLLNLLHLPSNTYDCDDCINYPCIIQDLSIDKKRKIKYNECGDKLLNA